MLGFGAAFDSFGLTNQQITLLFKKIVAEYSKSFGQFLIRIGSTPKILDGGHFYVAPQLDFRDEVNHLSTCDVEIVN